MLNSDIRDQAYQFFIEEAPELLEAIENGLLSLRVDRSTAKVHEIMRAAHSIKGGAASVQLDVIKTISHRLETIFKALYDETIEIDTTLESQLLEAYDCLRLPLITQIETGIIDTEQALTASDTIFTKLESRLGDALLQVDNYLPSSSDLGIDIVASIFEVDVAQGLERLHQVLQQPDAYPIAGELQAQAEVFMGLAELLNLPGFGGIAQAALTALEIQPEAALQILQLAVADLEAGRNAVLQGDRTQGGVPSAQLLALADAPVNLTSADALPLTDSITEPVMGKTTDELSSGELSSGSLLDDVPDFLALASEFELETEPLNFQREVRDNEYNFESLPLLEDVFGGLMDDSEFPQSSDDQELPIPSLDTVFGGELIWDEEALPDSNVVEAKESPTLEDLCASELSGLDQLNELNGCSEIAFEEPTVDQSIVGKAVGKALIEEAGINETDSGKIELRLINPDVELLPDTADAPILTSQPDLATVQQEGTLESIEIAVQSAERLFEQLPSLADQIAVQPVSQPQSVAKSEEEVGWKQPLRSDQPIAQAAPTNLSVRVDLHRLERMNNLVGELAINRNSLALQNDQLQGSVRDLVERFDRFQSLIGQLQDLSDRMLVAPVSRNSYRSGRVNQAEHMEAQTGTTSTLITSFDALEMDRYSILHFQLQEIFEQVMQLEEALGDVGLFAGQSNQTLGEQRQKMTQLQNELMWARMLPLGNVLNRFPRMLRDLSAKYKKSVSLKLSGTGVLVDKVVLEKLYDPLLHLLRNAFDHGIETSEIRQNQGKAEQGTIEIRAYHRGNQTLIEVADDGNGLDLQRIGQRAVELGWLSPDDLAHAKPAQLLDFIFEPGFSTASQVSELSGRGVGLDVVRGKLRSLKGNISVNYTAGEGTTFILRIPLTLTIAKLLTCMVGSNALAIPSDSVEEILVPKAEQIKHSGSQQFLHWRGQLVPVYRMSHLLNYACAASTSSASDALTPTPVPKEWALPMLVIKREQHSFVLEVDRLITEQELVIKPFGTALAAPAYTYGCTILGDGNLVPVIDAGTLVDLMLEPASGTAIPSKLLATPSVPSNSGTASLPTRQVKTILVVDDSATLRRMLALTLEKGGYRVLQARDGQEALTQLQQDSSVNLVVCDIEMPNMNGFEFLSQRRQNPAFAMIPVVILTSRSNDKHRRLAMHLGATAYFSKPYIEQEMIGALKQLLEASPVNQ